jgi:DNA-binding phage protein
MEYNLLSPEKIASALADRRLYKVSQETGISYGTLRKLQLNDGNPTLSVLQKISSYLTEGCKNV